MSIASISSAHPAMARLASTTRTEPQAVSAQAEVASRIQPESATVMRRAAVAHDEMQRARIAAASKGVTLSPEAATLAAKVAAAESAPMKDIKLAADSLKKFLSSHPDALNSEQETANSSSQLTLKGLLGAWGQSNSPYDLNGDGTVDMSDMLALLQNGGSMPMPEGQSEPLTLEGLLAAWGTDNSTFDLNGDGTVDTHDLLALLAKTGDKPANEPEPENQLTVKGLMGAWGQSDSPYDLNGDGTVDLSDLLALLQNGGTMPMPEGESEPLTLKGLLAAWGSSNPAFDLDGNGTVDEADLLMLMAKMGSSGSQIKGIASEDLPKGMTPDHLLNLAQANPAATEKTMSDLLSMFGDDESDQSS